MFKGEWPWIKGQEVRSCMLDFFRGQPGKGWGVWTQCRVLGCLSLSNISIENNSHPPALSAVPSQGLTTGCGLVFTRSCLWVPVKVPPPTPPEHPKNHMTTSCPTSSVLLSLLGPWQAPLQWKERRRSLERDLGRPPHPQLNFYTCWRSHWDLKLQRHLGDSEECKTAAVTALTQLRSLPAPHHSGTSLLSSAPKMPHPPLTLPLPSTHLVRAVNESPRGTAR